MKLSSSEEKWLNHFSYFYLDFLSTNFHGFKDQYESFRECFDFFLDHSNQVNIKTVDNTEFIYSLLFSTQESSTRYNPATNKSENYKRKKVVEKQTVVNVLGDCREQIILLKKNSEKEKDSLIKRTLENDIKKYRKKIKKHENVLKECKSELFTSFLANFTHTLDSSFIRMITKKMYEKEGYIIGNIHDCLMIHPNFCDSLNIEILGIFCKEFNINLEDLFFEPALKYLVENCSKEIVVKFKYLINEFKQKKGALIIHEKNIDIDNVFPHEHISKEVSYRNFK